MSAQQFQASLLPGVAVCALDTCATGQALALGDTLGNAHLLLAAATGESAMYNSAPQATVFPDQCLPFHTRVNISEPLADVFPLSAIPMRYPTLGEPPLASDWPDELCRHQYLKAQDPLEIFQAVKPVLLNATTKRQILVAPRDPSHPIFARGFPGAGRFDPNVTPKRVLNVIPYPQLHSTHASTSTTADLNTSEAQVTSENANSGSHSESPVRSLSRPAGEPIETPADTMNLLTLDPNIPSGATPLTARLLVASQSLI
jgi:hypothetical protein